MKTREIVIIGLIILACFLYYRYSEKKKMITKINEKIYNLERVKLDVSISEYISKDLKEKVRLNLALDSINTEIDNLKEKLHEINERKISISLEY